jgi:hypothetical protein
MRLLEFVAGDVTIPTQVIKYNQCCSRQISQSDYSISQNVGQDFLVLDFFHGRKILKVDGSDGRDPQNREKNAPAGRFTCMYRHDRVKNWALIISCYVLTLFFIQTTSTKQLLV